jgi:hypothetical protein
MTAKIEALVREVAKLDLEERFELVDRILQGLGNTASNVEGAWAEIAEVRLEGLRSGAIDSVDFDTFMNDAKEELARTRQRRLKPR